ncbi:FGGY-family carbohydrate kinase [Microbacterium sp. NPDC055910]|uniref:xylulokinase n=1 Tax=Microbacterium sp. NPDC055910 TaxID=3345659 RepID=UPI0035DD10B9
MTDLVLAVDCSTTGAKCIAWDLDGHAVASGRSELPLSIPHPGWGEQDPRDWWDATASAIRECVGRIDPDRVRALAVTHQRESFACIDAEGEALRPAMLWLDARAGAQVDRFGSARIHELTGKPPNPTPALYKLLWLAEHEPATLARTAKVVDVHGYLVHRLTGRWATSTASADPLGLMDFVKGSYSPEVLELVGLTEDRLADLVPPGDPIGTLTPSAADELGLAASVVIVSGSGDGQSAGLGAGVTAPGDAYLNLGTGLISGIFSPTYRPRLSHRSMAGAIAGSVNNELFVGAGTFLVSWFLNEIAAGEPDGVPREQYWQARAADIAPGAEGLFVVPYWNGQLTPLWDHRARGVMIGFGGVHTRAHIYRAVLEGIAFELRWCLEHAEPHFDERVREFVAMGGGARSPLWCQIFADVLGRPLVLAGHDEATALGVGILAAAGAGLHANVTDAAAHMTRRGHRYEPDPAAVRRYDALYGVYREVYPAVRPLFPAIEEVVDV